MRFLAALEHPGIARFLAGGRAAALALARELLPGAERLGLGGVVRDCRQILDRAAPASS